jgi:hypothetical protein
MVMFGLTIVLDGWVPIHVRTHFVKCPPMYALQVSPNR